MAMIHVMHCREIAKLLDSDGVKDLNFADRVQVRVHLWVCRHCRLLVRQIQWLGDVARDRVHRITEADEQLEARILQRLGLK
jgi:sigma54-dependent transcription regulator